MWSIKIIGHRCLARYVRSEKKKNTRSRCCYGLNHPTLYRPDVFCITFVPHDRSLPDKYTTKLSIGSFQLIFASNTNRMRLSRDKTRNNGLKFLHVDLMMILWQLTCDECAFYGPSSSINNNTLEYETSFVIRVQPSFYLIRIHILLQHLHSCINFHLSLSN